MGIAEELRQIEEMYAQGTLTRAEFEQAKAKVLAGDTPKQTAADSQTARQIAQLQQQNAAAQLDREWETERQQYMQRGRYGSRFVPTESGSIFGGICTVGVGIFLIALYSAPSSRSVGGLLPVMAFVCFVGSIVFSINSYTKAGHYRDAEQLYQEKRARLLSERDDA